MSQTSEYGLYFMKIEVFIGLSTDKEGVIINQSSDEYDQKNLEVYFSKRIY